MYKEYGIDKSKWSEIRDRVIKNELTSNQIIKEYELSSKQIWFLYDRLLQEKYNHLYKREKLVNPKVNDYVYCNYDGFGRGTIDSFSKDGNIMIVKFDSRSLKTFCDVKTMTTNFDDVARKITKL